MSGVRSTGWKNGFGRRFCKTIALLEITACRGQAPPGAEQEPAVQVVVGAEGVASAVPAAPADVSQARAAADLPFVPTGEQVASIAWRTWIYTDTGPQRTRYGYLRAGAVVDALGPPEVNAGCAGGWLRVNPRGFVCLGKGATQDLTHPVVVASKQRPQRGAGLPYLYALSTEIPPHLYFRLPTPEQMLSTEGPRALDHAAAFRLQIAGDWRGELLKVSPEVPPVLAGGEPLQKPYGVTSGLHYAAHAGQASADGGFAIFSAFDWQGRAFGLSTELDVVALDRMRVVRPTEFHGVELTGDEDLPAGVVSANWATTYRRSDDERAFLPEGTLKKRTVLKLTGKQEKVAGAHYYETGSGAWVLAVDLRIIEKRESFPSVATGDRKWIDVSIRDQSLVAYSGERARYVTLVSTGRGGMGDPETQLATIRGTFMVHTKHVTATMDGDEDKSDSANLRDVPFVQYFHNGFALHAAYWHDDFGKVRSHGCVNLAPQDAAWLFEWTDPNVPAHWHSAMNLERGTVVQVRY